MEVNDDICFRYGQQFPFVPIVSQRSIVLHIDI